MAPKFTIKQNDRLPEITGSCVDENGNAVNLTGATGVEFHMAPSGGGSVKVNAAGVIVNAAAGLVKYSWAAADTDTAGDFLGEFEVNFAAGPMTFPNHENIEITIVDDLA